METGRRLITSSSFAVGWLHLDGPVHLERERGRSRRRERKREKEEKGNPRLAQSDRNNRYNMLSGKGTCEMWQCSWR